MKNKGSLNVLLIVTFCVIYTPEGVLKQFQRDKFVEMFIKCRIVHFRHI